MIQRSPVLACGTPPDTGASINVPPAAATRFRQFTASRRIAESHRDDQRPLAQASAMHAVLAGQHRPPSAAAGRQHQDDDIGALRERAFDSGRRLRAVLFHEGRDAILR